MKVHFLGTGDARGVPVFRCKCHACTRARLFKNHIRKSSCCTIDFGGESFLIDAGSHELASVFEHKELKGIFLTHFHADHVQGLFHLRWGKGPQIPVWCPVDSEGCGDLYKHPGILDFKAINETYKSFAINRIKVTTIPLNHSKNTLGYCFEYDGERLSYLCDTKGLSPEATRFLLKWQPDCIIIDATHPPLSSKYSDGKNYNHNSTDEVLDLLNAFEKTNRVVPQFWLTHISHNMDCYLLENFSTLHPRLNIASDGQTIEVTGQGVWAGHLSSESKII